MTSAGFIKGLGFTIPAINVEEFESGESHDCNHILKAQPSLVQLLNEGGLDNVHLPFAGH